MSAPSKASPEKKTEAEAVSEPTPTSAFREVYPLNEPYSYAAITRDPTTGGLKYVVIEPTLLDQEKKHLEKVKGLLMEELDLDLKAIETREKAEQYLRKKIEQTSRRYRIKMEKETLDKLMYYVSRDFIHYGKIDPLMRDHMIEDISCDGVGVPLYIWHREYESIPTNVAFDGSQELNSFVVKLAYKAGRHISIAQPIVDASLPDGSRIQLTYGKEVTMRGSTFTIRRFRADPLTISDLIAFNTLSSDMAAYFWYAIEKKESFLITGGTASGKTTTLNALSMFIMPDYKIVSIEDTAELNLPHENWIPSVARMGFGSNEAEISLFDLLKAAMRQRSDYIIVGEVRGEEAYTLFQAMATGHGGLSSTHADSVSASIKRLESEPMNIPRSLIVTLDAIAVQARLRLGDKTVRRIQHVGELVSYDSASKEVVTNDVYKWDPKTDTFLYSGRSNVLEKISARFGLELESILEEVKRRKTVLDWMVKRGVRRYNDVAMVIRDYYANPTASYEKARLGLME